MLTKGNLLGVITKGVITSKWEVIDVNEKTGVLTAKCVENNLHYGPSVGKEDAGSLQAVLDSINKGRIVFIENALQRLKKRHGKK